MSKKTEDILYPKKRAKNDWFDDHPRKKGPFLIECPSCGVVVEWKTLPRDSNYKCMSCRDDKECCGE